MVTVAPYWNVNKYFFNFNLAFEIVTVAPYWNVNVVFPHFLLLS